jgi:ligand-binding SRPBCC domain-containing protein
MAFYCIKTEQRLPISINEAWEFFSSPKNLNEITPKDMRFIITNKPAKDMYAGQIITYKVSPLSGIKMDWMTEITQVVDKKHFIDEQRFGPYALWHHQHHFEEIDGGVLMKDEVNYKLPFGFLGTIAHTLFVKNKLKQIFNYRFRVLEERFGTL